MNAEALHKAFYHESPGDPERYFGRMLKELQGQIGATASVAMMRDMRSDVVTPLAFNDYPDSARKEYIEYFGRVDPWHRRFVQQRMPDGIWFSNEIISPRQFERMEFHNDYWRAHGFGDAVGMFGRIGDGLMFNFGFPRLREAGAYPEGVREKLQSALPHVEQAVRISRDFRRLILRSQIRNPLVDRLPLAVFLVGDDLKLIECNEGADELLIRRGWFTVKHGRLLHTVKSVENRIRARIRDLAAECADRYDWQQSGALGGPISCNEGSPHSIYVIPVLAEYRLCFHLAVTDLAYQPDRELLEKSLISLFDFTPAESEVAVAVFNGQRTQDIAFKRGVKLETVRGQIKSILAKAQCSSRVEMVRKISQLVVPFR